VPVEALWAHQRILQGSLVEDQRDRPRHD
jgi:hypothetical protein